MTPADDPSTEKRTLYYLEQLTHLLSHRSLDELLREALAFLVNSFQADGGSLLYASVFARQVSQGQLPKRAQKQIDDLQEAFRARLRQGMRDIQLPSSPPVTRRELPDEQSTLLTVPLTHLDRTLGMLCLVVPVDRDVSHQQLQELSQIVAGVSATAASTEQLLLSRQRLSQLGLFFQMGQAMTSTFEVSRLFEDTIDLAIAVTDASEARLMLLDAERRRLKCKMARGEIALPETDPPVGKGIVGWVAQHGAPALINDVTQDVRYDPEVDGLLAHGIRNLVCVPLQIKGTVIGVLQVLNKSRPPEFDEEDLSVLITLAGQVSIALDNARLYNSLRAERDRIIEVQESTRHELARNLHDGPVQLLAAIAMGLDYLKRVITDRPEMVDEELDALRSLVRQATQDARMLLFELRPVILETQGLVPALESYVERLSQNAKLEPHFDAGGVCRTFETSVAGTIFAIVQEAVNNAEKHAKATHVWIRLREEEGDLVVTVEDDGKGFDVPSVIANYDQGSSFGLLNMQERASLLDGVLTLRSGPTRGKPGTQIELRVAIPEAEEGNHG